MTDTRDRIAETLERSFAERGFAEPGVAELRERAGVSIRTLYKHFPSRGDMVLAALERRHQRYLEVLFPGNAAPDVIETLARVGRWMAENAPRGCLFHGAVAAHPDDPALRALLERHKAEVAQRLAACAGAPEHPTALLLIHEGLIQSWPLEGQDAVAAAQHLARILLANSS